MVLGQNLASVSVSILFIRLQLQYFLCNIYENVNVYKGPFVHNIGMWSRAAVRIHVSPTPTAAMHDITTQKTPTG